ncbi:MAG: hypothetical protein RI897_4091 [Verrucomicrobiota bacterium]
MVGVLLLPLCLSTSQTLFWVLLRSDVAAPVKQQVSGDKSGDGAVYSGENGRGGHAVGGRSEEVKRVLSLTFAPLLGGTLCWLVVYLLLQRPILLYVFGHELTHVIWAWVFEAKVKKFHVSSRGGHVVLDKVNFLIVLAPYFFPVYALLVALVYGVGNLLSDWTDYRVAFLFLLGVAYAFHVTLTWHALQTEQTDITSQGWLFSLVVIWLGNLAILIPGLCVLLGVSMEVMAREWVSATASVFRLLFWFV